MLATIAVNDSNNRDQTQNQGQSQQCLATPSVVKPADNADKANSAHPQSVAKSAAQTDCTAVAAEAAVEQARYSHTQANMAVVSALVSALTLLAAGAAAWFAKRAAEETEKSAITAQKALSLTNQTWALEHRPILVLQDFEKTLPYEYVTDAWTTKGAVALKPIWKNVGSLPATVSKQFNFAHVISVFITDIEVERLISELKMRDEDFDFVPVNSTISPLATQINIDSFDIRPSDLFTTKHVLYAVGVRYKSAIGTSESWESWRVIELVPQFESTEAFKLDGWWEAAMKEPFRAANRMT